MNVACESGCSGGSADLALFGVVSVVIAIGFIVLGLALVYASRDLRRPRALRDLVLGLVFLLGGATVLVLLFETFGR